MLDALRLYTRYAGVSMRSQMQYRVSFLMQACGQFLINILEFLAIWTLLSRFGNVQGWRLPELGLLYGIANVAWGINDALSHGFDAFGATVKAGDFDRILLRPRSTVLQLAGQEVTLRRIGRVLQGLVVLGWAVSVLEIAWTPGKILLVVLGIFGGAAMFYGLLIVQATMCFWTTETIEIMNALTYGGVHTARFPISIYGRWFQRVFTFVVPVAGMNYFPALEVLEKPDPLGFPAWFHWMSPLLGFVFFAVAVQVWRFGIRRYQSTGS